MSRGDMHLTWNWINGPVPMTHPCDPLIFLRQISVIT